jgi:hypothetical protein
VSFGDEPIHLITKQHIDAAVVESTDPNINLSVVNPLQLNLKHCFSVPPYISIANDAPSAFRFEDWDYWLARGRIRLDELVFERCEVLGDSFDFWGVGGAERPRFAPESQRDPVLFPQLSLRHRDGLH